MPRRGVADTPGAEFARALAAKDSARLLELMHPEIDFRALTPNRSWEAGSPDEVLSVLLDKWFEDKDEIEALERLDSDEVADRQRVGYRFSVNNPDGRIEWMRVVCSGLRPAAPAE